MMSDKQTQGVHQSQDTGVSERKRGSPLPVAHRRLDDRQEPIFAHRAVVPERFDVQEPSVGCKADPA